MDRFKPISITNSSLGAHLYSSEEVYLLTSNVGLYSGPFKSLPHSSGTVYLTSHRIFYIDDDKPHSHSCYLSLDLIRETQYYAGFLKSSPKVTLTFKRYEEDADSPRKEITPKISGGSNDWRQMARVRDNDPLLIEGPPRSSWTCRICAYRNITERMSDSLDASVKCQLCGVNSLIKDVVVVEEQKKSTSNGTVAASSTPTSKDGITCPACTFANHPSMSRCEICDTPLRTIDPAQLIASTSRKQQQLDSLSSSRAQTPVLKEDEVERHDSVRLSFRKSGDKAFYSILKTTLQEKSWQKMASSIQGTHKNSRQHRFTSTHRNIDGRTASSALDNREEGGDAIGSNRRVGIEAVFSAIDLQSRVESDDMRDAFRDLEALMMRAKKMVDLAESVNAKLTKREAAGKGAGVDGKEDDEAAYIIRSSLVRLGLPTPAITLDMAKDEMEYNLQLANELANLLYTGSSPLMGRGRVMQRPVQRHHPADQNVESSDAAKIGRGILPLDELWCMWNRARGVALISPKTLLDVCEILPTITLPQIDCKTFQSGLRVLHTSRYQPSNFSIRILKHLQQKKKTISNEDVSSSSDQQSRYLANVNLGATTLEVAKQEDCPLHLVTELLHEVEYEFGTLVKDGSGQESWHENLITQFNWDHWQEHRH